MRTQNITLAGLTVVDVESLAHDVFKDYYKDLYQLYGSEIKDKDANKLLLFHTLNRLINYFKGVDNRKNTVFYINTEIIGPRMEHRFLKVFKTICKVFPVVCYSSALDFNCLEQNSGCNEELATLIKEYRFNFDFNKFSPRKMKTFLDKYQIKLTFPI
jgi:hypothetical protein